MKKNTMSKKDIILKILKRLFISNTIIFILFILLIYLFEFDFLYYVLWFCILYNSLKIVLKVLYRSGIITIKGRILRQFLSRNSNIYRRLYAMLFRLYFQNVYKRSVKKSRNLKLNDKPRDKKIVVSLTTFGERIFQVDLVIKSLLKQKVKADVIVLYLDEKEFNLKNIPAELKMLNDKKLLEIRFCYNYKSFKKFIPVFKGEYKNEIIITADDDLMYMPTFIKKLYNKYQKDKSRIPCYIIWDKNVNIDYDVIGTGLGALFTIESIHKDLLNYKLVEKLTDTNDDLLVSFLLDRKGVKLNPVFKKIADSWYVLFVQTLPHALDKTALWQTNNMEKRDQDIQNIKNHYRNLKV
ncbi:MAG: hypothetical protein JJV93_03330 [Alphaproteobacteria bacterium]|nr:hypothetical protein [Alphaproteobacteria bacterium]